MSELLDRLLTPQQRADVAASDAALSHYQGQAAIAELGRLNGAGLQPQPGCKLARLALGESEAWVEYKPAGPSIRYALVNGRMIDAALFAPAVLEQWEQAISELEAEIEGEAALESVGARDEDPSESYADFAAARGDR